MYNIENTPMTQIEKMLCECLEKRPDIKNRILTSEELLEYIMWMAKSHTSFSPVDFSDIPVLPTQLNMASSFNALHTSNVSGKSGEFLTTLYTSQREDQYILADHDISAGRMLRYMPAHWHSNAYFEIYYCFSGTCTVYFRSETVTLRPGTVLIVAPSVEHATPCFSDDSIMAFYMVRASTFDQVFWNQLPPESLMATFFKKALAADHPSAYLQFESGIDTDIRLLLSSVFELYYEDGPYRSQLLNSLMSTFLVLLLRRYEGTAKLPRTADMYWKHEFSAILSYIQANFATVTQQELSRKFHYSPRQISRIVQGCMGMTYNSLITKLRMERATTLLHQSGMPMEQVSSAVGYSDVSSFYRAFTKYYGHTPGNLTAKKRR